MNPRSNQKSLLVRALPLLALAFLLANFTHFAHNAEYLPYYPGMPSWLTREQIYLVWLAGVSLFLVAFILYRFQHLKLATLSLGAYGATGLDGLLHYTLALCSEHTLGTNLTIWAEVALGSTLFLACCIKFARLLSAPRAMST